MSAPQGAAAAEAVEGAAHAVGSAAYSGGKSAAKGVSNICNWFGGCVKRLSPATVTILLRVMNIGNAICLGFACFFAYTIVNGSITRAFLATYIGIFACLLLFFEMRVSYTSVWIRKNFGFLFTWTGRTIFLIFLGAVCFGMLGEDVKSTMGYTWCVTVGIATLCNAVFNCFIICNHPGFQEMNKPDHAGPAAGSDPSKMTDEQIRAYLAAHPELLSSVAGAEVREGEVAVQVEGEDWATGAGKSNKSGGGGGMFSMFGGRGKAPKAGPVPAPTYTGEAKSESYEPPVIPAASASASSTRSAPAEYAPPPAAPPAPASSFAIAEDDDNPFAATGSANPYQ